MPTIVNRQQARTISLKLRGRQKNWGWGVRNIKKDLTFNVFVVHQGVLRLIWSGRLECVFVDPKGAKISKNGNKITCRLSKNKHFLFYTQGRGGNIMPATPS